MTTTDVQRETKAQLDLIDGGWSRPSETLRATLDDPNTGRPLQQQAATAADQVELAISAAARLHADQTWANSSVEARVQLLHDIADRLADRTAELAFEDAMATGNPISVARIVASSLGPRVRASAAELLTVGVGGSLPADGRDVRLLRLPLGPAAVLAPWNAPTFVAIAKVASGLAAGCPVILKPSEWAPGGCQIIAELIQDSIASLDLPPAVFQLVHGGAAVGSQIASDPRIRAISFTGGHAGGMAVASAAAPHFTALQLELGGHNPAIVLPDADVPAAAAAIAEGMTKLNGQWCEAPGKILVPSRQHDEFVDALLAELGTLSVGPTFDESTDVGPLAHRTHREHLQQRIDALVANGATARTANDLPGLGGWFFAPTVVTGLPAEASLLELFGPAVSVHAVDGVEAAVAAANGPETGLAGFAFGGDIDAAMQVAVRIPAGEVRVNGCKLADLAEGSAQSFWNNAGLGAHGPTDMLRFFQGRRTVGVDDPTLAI